MQRQRVNRARQLLCKQAVYALVTLHQTQTLEPVSLK
jgi:hypothetical protein